MGIHVYVEEWLNGNENSFNHILKHYYLMLSPRCSRFVNNDEDAEELVMNVILKIWQNKLRFNEVSSINNYVYAMLRQEIALFARKKIVQKLSLEDVSISDLGKEDHPELNYKELFQQYQSALEKLTPKQREIFLSVSEQGINRKQISKETGLSIHTINNHMNNAMKVLRNEMKDYPDALVALIILTAAGYSLVH